MVTTENPEAVANKVEKKVFDPYLYYADMPFTGMYYPLGFPVELKSNSQEVLESADESWGDCRQQFDLQPLRLHIGVQNDGSTECPPAPVSRAQQNLMVRVADSSNFFAADLVNGFSFGWINTATISRRNYFRYHYLESAALSHIANRYTAPIHAACVGLDGLGVLLCGDSGAGKSSLSFACALAGWSYTTDDATFVLQGRDDRQVVGHCHTIRLRPSGAELFVELAGKPITPRAAGKPSIELRTSEIPSITMAPATQVGYVVFLNRKDGDVQELIPYPKESARRYMEMHLNGLDALRKGQIEVMEKLLGVEIFELRYRDMNWAIDRLERLVRENR